MKITNQPKQEYYTMNITLTDDNKTNAELAIVLLQSAIAGNIAIDSLTFVQDVLVSIISEDTVSNVVNIAEYRVEKVSNAVRKYGIVGPDGVLVLNGNGFPRVFKLKARAKEKAAILNAA